MILDNLLTFDLNSTITVVGGTQASANVLDLHIINGGLPVLSNNQGARDIGIGDDPAMKILVVVTTAFSGGTSMSVAFQGATDNGSGVPNAFTTWYTTPVYTTAQLVLGARLMDMDVPRPPAAVAVPRFLRLLYTTVGAATGVVGSYLVLDRDDQMYQGTGNQNYGGYPAGVTVAN
jgi:hypothetical protein